jgi:hypothetical protein
MLSGAHGRVQEQDAHDVAPGWRQGAVVGEHHGGGAVPGHHVPEGGLDDGRAVPQRVQHALQARTDAFVRCVARLGRAAQTQDEQMLALGVGQQERGGEAFQHLGRSRAASALFQPGVPGGADVGALGDLFAAQARRAAAPGKAEAGRIQPRAAAAQESTQGFVRERHDSKGGSMLSIIRAN